MAPMTTRRAVLIGILAGILVGIGVASLAWIVADRNRQPEHPPAAAATTIPPGATQPTIPPPPTATALAAGLVVIEEITKLVLRRQEHATHGDVHDTA